MIGIGPARAEIALEKSALIEKETAAKIKDLLKETLKFWGPIYPKFKIDTCFFNRSDIVKIEIDAIKVAELPNFTLILRPSGLLYLVFNESGLKLIHRAQEASPRIYIEYAHKAIVAAVYGHNEIWT